MLLGVTPEIALMHWPPPTRVVAVDRSHTMIRKVWPGGPLGHAAVCADWSMLPLRNGSQDIVAGDACFSSLAYPGEYSALVREIRRVIATRGVVVMRFFVRPEMREQPERVFDHLRQGRIGNFNVFKWRLAMALHGSLDQGVRLSDIWEAWHAAVPNPALLARELGWPLDAVTAIDAYRGNDTRYTFPTLAEARTTMSAGFRETGAFTPPYELGDRCPTLTFQPA
jgi:hypothetical protein